MKRIRPFAVGMTLAACLGVLIPQPAFAEAGQTQPHHQKTLDVALRTGGVLVGQLVDAQGKAKPGAPVILRRDASEVARVKTDSKGRFAIEQLSSGTYKLVSASGQMQVRIWSPETAPPNAKHAALLVDGTTVRGQFGGVAGGVGASTATVATAVVASVAIPTVVGGVIDVGILDLDDAS